MDNSRYDQFLSCRPKLYRFALSLTKNVDDAEDLFQETTLKLLQLEHKWAEWRNFEAFAMRMVRNAFLNSIKKNGSRLQLQLEEMGNEPVEDSTTRQIELAHLKLTFYNLTSQLPHVQQQILHLREIEEMEYKEIAEVLSLTETQVKVYLHRGRQHIKNKLDGKR